MSFQQAPGTAEREVIVAVLLSYNSLETLKQTVAAVSKQTRMPDQLVIVDNGSNDRTPVWLAGVAKERTWVDAVQHDLNVGVGAGHAAGWRRALHLRPDCTAIWVLEHDCLPPADTLERLLSHPALRESPGGVIVPHQEFPNRARTVASRARKLVRLAGRKMAPGLSLLQVRTSPLPIDRKFTFNGILLPVKIVEDVGLPRADFFVGLEDREYAHRVRAAGYTIDRDPSIMVKHVRAEHGGLADPLRWYYSSRNSIYMDRKVFRRPLAAPRAILRFIAAMAVVGLGARDRRTYAAARFLGLRDGLLGRLGKADHSFLTRPR